MIAWRHSATDAATRFPKATFLSLISSPDCPDAASQGRQSLRWRSTPIAQKKTRK
jgi:hypothetical protein